MGERGSKLAIGLDPILSCVEPLKVASLPLGAG
jgi:hypothetical protein